MPSELHAKLHQNVGRPILANLPPFPCPIMSDFDNPTYQPKDRTSYVDGPFCKISQAYFWKKWPRSMYIFPYDTSTAVVS